MRNDRNPGKILFLTKGSFSHITVNVARVLANAYPELIVERWDAADWLAEPQRRTLRILNRLYLHVLLPTETILEPGRVWNYFYQTPLVFYAIRRCLKKTFRQRAGEYVFSFQLQSLFDGAVSGVPHFVYTDHTHLANMYYPDYERFITVLSSWLRLEKSIYTHAARVLTMSRHVSRSVIEHYGIPRDRVVCVFAGCNVSPAVLAHRVARSRSSETVHILFVGREWERKGGPDLVEAFRLLRTSGFDIRLTIVGCSPHVGIPGVNVVGEIPPEEVSSYYRESDIFCFPTRREPFGIAAIEAMMHGLPVVVADIGAMRDFVEHRRTGFLVPPARPDLLADALRELIRSPELRTEIAMRGRDLVAERYTWEATGRRMKEVVDACLGEAEI